MKKYGIITLCLGMFFINSAWADDKKIQADRSLVAANIFKKICFMTLANHDKVVKLADEVFIRFEDKAKKSVFLNIFKAEEGIVWAANFPKGNFIIVSEPKNKCHIIPQKANDKLLHKYIKNISNEANKNLPYSNVKYTYTPKNKTNEYDVSNIEISSTIDGMVLLTSSITTIHNPPKNKPAALMSVIAR